MNKDTSLKSNEQNLVLLIVGNDDTGKKTLVNTWMNKYLPESEETKTFYKIFYFMYEDTLEDEPFSIKVEVRIINGDELESDLKSISAFFKGAYGAFVVTSFDEYVSFQDGVKWKEKVDLMCCLPNKFPLPVNLVINKCDLIEQKERRPWLEKHQFENYVRENQFINHFFVSSKQGKLLNRESLQSNQSAEVDSPLKDIIRTIFQFKDIRSSFLSLNKDQQARNISKTNAKDINGSTSSTKSKPDSKKGKSDGNCTIL